MKEVKFEAPSGNDEVSLSHALLGCGEHADKDFNWAVSPAATAAKEGTASDRQTQSAPRTNVKCEHPYCFPTPLWLFPSVC